MAVVSSRRRLNCRVSQSEYELIQNTCWYYGYSKKTFFKRLIWKAVTTQNIGFTALDHHNRGYQCNLDVPLNIFNIWMERCLQYKSLTCEDKKGNTVYDSNYLLRQLIHSSPVVVKPRDVITNRSFDIKVLEFLQPVSDNWHLFTGTQQYADYN